MSRESISSAGISGPIPDSFVTSSANTIYIAYAAYLDFSGSTIRAWTGLNNVTLNDDFGGGVYTALGQYGSIGNSQEVSDVVSKTYELSLSGIPSENIGLALNTNYRGRDVAVYMLLFDAAYDTYQQVTAFRGWMDQITISNSGANSNIKVSCESRLIQFQNPVQLWYSDQCQQQLYPGDLGLQYITSMAGQDIYWGSAAPSQGNLIASPIGTSGGGVSGNRPPP